jgi:hypothetical protein
MKREAHLHRSNRRPFWLPALTYYFLSAAIAIGVFFLVWAILAETPDEKPWITAGLLSSFSLISSVVVREVILRTRRQKVFETQRKLDSILLAAPASARRHSNPIKLTLERNRVLLDEIVRKSEAAKVLTKLAESHKEVFQLCEGYLEVAARELPSVGIGSPRLAALTRGRGKVERLHRSHMLKWVEIEVKAHTQAAADAERTGVKIEKAHLALEAVNTALSHYPNEINILETKQVIEQLIFSINVTGVIRRAERAETRGNFVKALERLREAENIIESEGYGIGGSETIRERLRNDIERLERMGIIG